MCRRKSFRLNIEGVERNSRKNVVTIVMGVTWYDTVAYDIIAEVSFY